MKIKALVNAHILGIVDGSFFNKEGEPQKFFKANILQDAGKSIAELRVTKELAAQLEQGKEYTLTAEYSESKFGNSFKITGIQDTNSTGKEV